MAARNMYRKLPYVKFRSVVVRRLVGWLVGRLTSPFSTKICYIGDKVLGGDLRGSEAKETCKRSGRTYKEIHRHTHASHNTLHPSRGRSNK